MKNKFLIAATMLLLATMSIAQGPFNIGTINPGDSIVIYYDVTINTSCACTQISNQGVISGSNFSTFNTDDPATAAVADPTITMLNLFPLPVRFYDLAAMPVNGSIQVSWKTASESNMIKYEIERSSDGISFNRIGEKTALNNGLDHHYLFLDGNPFAGTNFYRIRMIEQGAPDRYSTIVRVSLLGNAGIAVYPNPVQGRQLTLLLTDLPKADYQLFIFNSNGQRVYSLPYSHNGGSVAKTIQLPVSLKAGIYHLQILTGEKSWQFPVMLL